MQVAEIKISYSTKVPVNDRVKLASSADAALILRPLYQDHIEYCEAVRILLLDQSNRVLGVANICEGGLGSCMFDIRKIFQAALKANAAGIICCHNHPSGNLKPSDDDIKVTKRAKEVGALMEIHVVDHIILTVDSFTSLADEGYI